jgi:3-hydroxybutyryl-CoA dehydrogenase
VVAVEADEAALERGLAAVRRGLARRAEKGTLEPAGGDPEAVLGALRPSGSLEDLADVDFVLEAIVERQPEKDALFARLGAICPPHAVFASNTSSLSVTAMGAASGRPDRMTGMHFFNPVPVLPLVEVVRTVLTSDEAFATAWAVAERMGKTPIAAHDRPGFIVNRIVIPVLNEGVRLVEEGASPEDVDTGCRLGLNWPIGPLALIDLVGVDVQLKATEGMYEAFGDERFRPPTLMRRMVEAGLLGRKTGRGFYAYG